MAILLNFFDNVILQAITEEIVPKRGFFKDRYFPTGAGDIFKADEVLTEYRKGDRKLAAFVAPDVHDIPIARRGYEVHSYQPAYIAPSRVLTMDELKKRGFGEALYPGMDEAQRAARLLADDMNDMENRIAATIPTLSQRSGTPLAATSGQTLRLCAGCSLIAACLQKT